MIITMVIGPWVYIVIYGNIICYLIEQVWGIFIDDIKETHMKCEKPSNIFVSQLEYTQWAC